jgi:hypothetical protein
VTNNKGFWIGWLDLLSPSLQTLLIAINYNASQPIYSLTLLPGLCEDSLHSHFRTTSHLIMFCTTYIVSRRIHRKHVPCSGMDICESHTKHLLLYCRIYSALHSNGSYPIVACVFIIAEMCSPSRCPATGLHVTIYIYIYVCVCVCMCKREIEMQIDGYNVGVSIIFTAIKPRRCMLHAWVTNHSFRIYVWKLIQKKLD